MKIAMRVTIELDRDVWATEYGCGESAADVRADVRAYVKEALQGMPVEPESVEIK